MEHLRCNDSRLGGAEAQSKRTLPLKNYQDTGPVETVKTTTNEEYLETLLAKALQRHGENAFSVRQLRSQLASLRYFKKVKPLQGTEVEEFHVGARGEASEDLQPGKYQEDMYGNPLMSPEERAEAEAEEES